MPVYQSTANGYVAYKVQSGIGVQASGAGGTILRQTGGAGANLTKAATQSNEVRRDGMQIRGRHGTQKTTGAWTAEYSKGSHEEIIQAIMRDTWTTADLALTNASGTLGQITTGVNTIVNSGDSWITQGVRVGDVWRLTGQTTSVSNNGKNLRVTGVTASTITVAETLVANAVGSNFTLTRSGKKLTQYSTSALTDRYYTIDEYDVDIDQSTVLTDFVWDNVKFTMAPDGLLMVDPGGMGTGQIAANSAGTSPLLTAPTETSAVPYSVVDATIRVNGVDVVELTAFDLTLSLGASAPSVFGSGAQKYSPDVAKGQMQIGMNLTALRKNLTYLSDFIAETVYSLHVLAVANMTEPKDFLSLYVPNFTLGGNTRSALSKAGGFLTETIAIPAALVGKDTSGGAFDGTMIKVQSTGA